MTNETTLNAQQSVDVIEKMTRNSNKIFEKETAIPFLVMGYASVIASIIVFLMYPSMSHRANLFWILIAVVGLIYYIYDYRTQKPSSSFTLTAKFMSILWLVLGINCVLCSFLIPSDFILTFVIVIIGCGATITAYLLNLKPLVISSIFAQLIGYSMVFIPLGSYRSLVLGLAFLVMLVIPGHYLMIKSRK